jgi:replicative DNA helicase
LALAIGERIATRKGGTVLLFSLEMSAEAIMRRRLAAESGVFLSRIRAGDIADGQWGLLLDASNRLADRPFRVIDAPRYRYVERLVAMAETVAMEKDLSVIIIDHIQEIKSIKKTQNRNLELGEIARSIKYLGRDLNVPTVVLSQLSRTTEGRTSPHPRLSDMRDSGELEQIADGVIGVYRATKETEVLELGGLKGRDTGTWKTNLRFDRFTQRISE